MAQGVLGMEQEELDLLAYALPSAPNLHDNDHLLSFLQRPGIKTRDFEQIETASGNWDCTLFVFLHFFLRRSMGSALLLRL